MKSNPNIIKRIEVMYYRSLKKVLLRDCAPFNVITGANDTGKSNILRALNIFFNEKEVGDDGPIFSDSLSHTRLNEVRKDTIKGKQFIKISIDFNRGEACKKTLPDVFQVTKTWFRDGSSKYRNNVESVLKRKGMDNIKEGNIKNSLSRFLNSITYTYVPAIRDQNAYENILGKLREALIAQYKNDGSDFEKEISNLNSNIREHTSTLQREFMDATGVDVKVLLPSSYGGLLDVADIQTSGEFEETVPMKNRGDGIRMLFLPTILNYISSRTRKRHIWGFEEPENSVEYKRAFELKRMMSEEYSKNAQIFITTHSPAFMDLEDKDLSIYLVCRSSNDTEIEMLTSKGESVDHGGIEDRLANELGHIQAMGKMHEEYKKEIASYKKPIIMLEGKTDVQILKCAWSKLYGGEPNFKIQSCSTLSEEDGQNAGAEQLTRRLKTRSYDDLNIVIGVFDHDVEGLRQFEKKLGTSFEENKCFQGNVKLSANRKAAALTLPIPKGKEDYGRVKNLSIEFLFPDEVLETKIDGYGLELVPKEIEERAEGEKLSIRDADEPHLRKIITGENHFCYHVVPTLDSRFFDNFKLLFDLIEEIIEFLSSSKN